MVLGGELFVQACEVVVVLGPLPPTLGGSSGEVVSPGRLHSPLRYPLLLLCLLSTPLDQPVDLRVYRIFSPAPGPRLRHAPSPNTRRRLCLPRPGGL